MESGNTINTEINSENENYTGEKVMTNSDEMMADIAVSEQKRQRKKLHVIL